MIKLYTLQKELAAKKLQLQKLIEEKNQAQVSKAESKLIRKLMNLTASVPADKKAELPAPLKAALAEVKAFSKEESNKLAKVEKESKQTMAALDVDMKKGVPI